MKKIAAAAVAATMTVSLAAAPAADAASNTMLKDGRCYLQLEAGPSGKISKKDAEKALKEYESAAELLVASSELSQAFGSSSPEGVKEVNDLQAIQACAKGVNFQSTPMTKLKQAGIIIGVILAVIGAIAPIVAPMIQQHLPF